MDRVVFAAVLAVPAVFVWAHPRTRVTAGEAAGAMRTVNLAIAGVLVLFAAAALLRRGHAAARTLAVGCLAFAVGAHATVRELAMRAERTVALAQDARRLEEANTDLVTPIRVIAVLLALSAAYLFVKAARAGAWSVAFALSGCLLAADVVLLTVFV